MSEIDKQYARLFRLQDDPVRQEYMEWLNFLVNIDVISEALKVCATTEFPEDSISPLYVTFALNLQNYFINAQGLLENNKFISGSEQPRRFKALTTIAKSVRNKVAHKGVWIATPVRGVVSGKGLYSFYSYPIEDLKESLEEMKNRELSRDLKRENNRGVLEKKRYKIEEKYSLAFELLENQYQDDLFYILEFMKLHYKDFVGYILIEYRKKLKKKGFERYSALRKEAGYRAIEDRIESIKSVYDDLCEGL